MSLRSKFGRLYREAFKSLRLVGVKSLPMRFNGQWRMWPIQKWDGFCETFEPYVFEILNRGLKLGSTFFDVGAHHGVWSLVASEIVGDSGKVVACEPSPAFNTLSQLLGKKRNVVCLNVAIGESEGTAEFAAQGEASTGSLSRDVTAINEHYYYGVPITSITVQITTIDSLLNDSCHRVFKIDVEGFEAAVIRGAEKALVEGAVWIVEVHPPQARKFGFNVNSIFDTFARHGYQTEIVDRHDANPDSLFTILAKRSPSSG